MTDAQIPAARSGTRILTTAEIERLDNLLDAANPRGSMLPEELDGFFAALACCPQPVPWGEVARTIIGRAADDPADWPDSPDAQALDKLLTRHWHTMCAQLYEGESLTPVMALDEKGRADGHDWAHGFLRGLAMRPDAWQMADDDQDMADALAPIMKIGEQAQLLMQQADDEAAGKTAAGQPAADLAPVDADRQEEAVDQMLGGVMDLYDLMAAERARQQAPAEPIRRDAPKVGRNDPCPCGSGRKFKACHGK